METYLHVILPPQRNNSRFGRVSLWLSRRAWQLRLRKLLDLSTPPTNDDYEDDATTNKGSSTRQNTNAVEVKDDEQSKNCWVRRAFLNYFATCPTIQNTREFPKCWPRPSSKPKSGTLFPRSNCSNALRRTWKLPSIRFWRVQRTNWKFEDMSNFRYASWPWRNCPAILAEATRKEPPNDPIRNCPGPHP